MLPPGRALKTRWGKRLDTRGRVVQDPCTRHAQDRPRRGGRGRGRGRACAPASGSLWWDGNGLALGGGEACPTLKPLSCAS